MQLKPSRVILFVPFVAGAVAGACAAIEEPNNDTLAALRVDLENQAAGSATTSTVSTMTGSAALPTVPTVPVATGTGTDSAAPTVPPPPDGTVSMAMPLPTAPMTTMSTTGVPTATSVPSMTSTSAATSTSTPPMMTTAAPMPTMSAPMGSGGAGGVADPDPPLPVGDGGASLPNCGEDLGMLADAVLNATQVTAEYITYDSQPNGQVQFQIRLKNAGLMTVQLRNIRVRYWFEPEADATIILDSAAPELMTTTVTEGETPDGTQKYLEFEFPEDAALETTTGATTPPYVQVRMQLVQNSGNVQNDNSNDWSWDPTNSVWQANDHLTVYRLTSDNKLALLAGEAPCP